ncbi:nucleotide sugar dehydrogenase [Marinifilum caeruleilacunae]|uniref:Nucleotide sugar dehydrogenase n=1 Tax=Marinifilum caeruleilacunae TaxID=2499076 RepID=A0ABX1WSX3_9BACT|nr:nucleotide sugar dehydrogenase [Marinifilum caeruleilacunae]NOU59219.1 nucleotide sugar dehydrogenase [Marinifilum caeruleilacunae]
MENIKIAIIGLGYVGLPLAVEFAKKYPVVGFDIDANRVFELNKGHDATLEVEDDNLQSVLKDEKWNGLYLSASLEDINDANYYIVTVPTPITEDKRPDMTPLINASQTVGKVISKGDIVIYESTVYPGATEEVCLPVVEEVSGLKFNEDFFAGYSPERINPGDKVNTLLTIKKVTSGSTPEIAEDVDKLYNAILLNGTHKASSLKVAEASKVIENAQRDLNISFVNELALIFDRIGIDTNEVIEAAGSKWNFLKFKPGLVGGHCISVDPYYLKWKAEQLGYQPDVISSGRKVNDVMGQFVAHKVIKLMIEKGHRIKGSKILVLGFTFKENCPDIRNTKIVDVIDELKEFGTNVKICDPWADEQEVNHEYGFDVENNIDTVMTEKYDAVILAVSHKEFLSLNMDELKNGHDAVIYDIKGCWDKDLVDGRL